MKSIVISGPEASGKSTLARMLAANYKTVECISIIDRRELSEDTECIIVDEVHSHREFADFNVHAMQDSILIRPSYSNFMVNCRPKLLICISQVPVEKQRFPNSLLFTLK